MNKLFLYGAGGLGREMKSLVDCLAAWKVIGYFDDGIKKGTTVYGLPVLGNFDDLVAWPNACNLVITIGLPELKSVLLNRMANIDLNFPILKHPSSIIQDPHSVTLGAGSILTAGTILTTGINIGRHVLLNINCTVGHDVTIGDGSSIMPGVNIAGNVQIGKNVLIGSGANILNGVRIEDNAIIGAGAVVTRDVAAGKTVAGVPAKPMK